MKSILHFIIKIICILSPPTIVVKIYYPLFKVIAKINYNYANTIVGVFRKKFSQYYEKENQLIRFKTYNNLYIFLPNSDNHLIDRAVGSYHPTDFLIYLNLYLDRIKSACEIGTHLGELTLHIASKLNGGRFFAFEIDKNFHSIVSQSIYENKFDNVTYENCAIGNKGIIELGNGYCDFETTMNNFPELNIAGSLNTDYFTKEPKDWDQGEIKNKEKVKVERVDLYEYFLKKEFAPELFFMDIEGSEIYAIPMILKLAEHFKYKPIIIFEIHHYAYSSYHSKMLREELKKFGYKMTTPDQRHIFCE